MLLSAENIYNFILHTCIACMVNKFRPKPTFTLQGCSDSNWILLLWCVTDLLFLLGLCGHRNPIFLNQIWFTFICGPKSYTYLVCGRATWMNSDWNSFGFLPIRMHGTGSFLVPIHTYLGAAVPEIAVKAAKTSLDFYRLLNLIMYSWWTICHSLAHDAVLTLATSTSI